MSWLPHWTFKQWAALILTSFIALLFLFVALVLWIAQDEDLLDDSDLRIAPAEGRDYKSNDNGYQRILVFQEMLQDEESVLSLHSIMEAKNGAPDWDALRQLLVEKEAALSQVDHILAAPYFTCPWPLTVETEMSEYSRTFYLGRLLAAQARLAKHDGNLVAAWKDISSCLHLGEKMIGGDGPLVAHLVGISLYAVGLGVIDDHLESFSPNGEITRSRTDWLRQFIINPNELQRAFRYEYMWSQDLIAVAEAAMRQERQSESAYLIFQYKPNATRNLYGPFFRELMENAKRPIEEQSFPLYDSAPDDLGWRHIISGNYLGFMMMGVTAPTLGKACEKYLGVNSTLQLTRLGLALAGYANEHDGALPDSLEALAPTYIDAIPLDPITGEAFFYNAEKRKVWSVGKDLRDDGGLPRGDRGRDDPHDLVVEIPEDKPSTDVPGG